MYITSELLLLLLLLFLLLLVLLVSGIRFKFVQPKNRLTNCNPNRLFFSRIAPKSMQKVE